MEDRFKNINKNIIEEILFLVEEESMCYIDAIIHIAEKRNLEIEFVGEIVRKNDKITALIQEEAEKLNWIKKVDRIEIE